MRKMIKEHCFVSVIAGIINVTRYFFAMKESYPMFFLTQI